MLHSYTCCLELLCYAMLGVKVRPEVRRQIVTLISTDRSTFDGTALSQQDTQGITPRRFSK